jgi:hypothetical protein
LRPRRESALDLRCLVRVLVRGAGKKIVQNGGFWYRSGRLGARYCSQGMVLAVKIDGLGALAGFWTPWGSILLPGHGFGSQN